MRSRLVVALVLAVVLLVAVPPTALATSPPADRIQETWKGDQTGVVYSINANGPISFEDASEVCFTLDYDRPWSEAAWSLVVNGEKAIMTATVVFTRGLNAVEAQAFVTVNGERSTVRLIDNLHTTGKADRCLSFEGLYGGPYGDEVRVLVGAPEAAWTKAEVDLQTTKTVNWRSNTLASQAGLWALDRGMGSNSGLLGADVRTGVAQASVNWGIDHSVQPGNRTFALAAPMPTSVGWGSWSIEGPSTWDASWPLVPGAPAVAGLGAISLWNAPEGTYEFRYDAVSVGALPGFFALLIPYEPPDFPSKP